MDKSVKTRAGRNGGQLRDGSPKGNTGGIGRPPNELRSLARQAFNDRGAMNRICDILTNGKDRESLAAAKLLGEWGWPELKKLEITGAEGGPVEHKIIVEYVDRPIEVADHD